MTLIMATYAPHRWAAASAWVPITDLRAWHKETKASGHNYWQDVEAICGGAPDASAEVEGEYEYRSPLFHLDQARGLPIEISAGIHDGYTGSVPISHTLNAFDEFAKMYDAPTIPEDIRFRLEHRRVNIDDAKWNPAYDRAIHWRGHAGPTRATIFEGGHEMLPEAACVFLEKHHK